MPPACAAHRFPLPAVRQHHAAQDTLPPVHVAWLFEYPTLCGGELSLLAVAPHLRAQGVQITALAPPTGPLAQRLAQLELENCPFAACEFPDKSAARAILERLLLRLRPDLVHANSLAAGRLCGPVLRQLGLPGLAHLRDIVRLGRQGLQDLACHHRLLAVSAAVRHWHVAQGLPPELVHVLYNGVDVARFAPRQPLGVLHRELALPSHAVLAGSVGQLVLRKGLDVLLEAMRLLAPVMPELHLVHCGERYSQKPEAVAYEERLRKAAAAPPLAGRCHFLGYRADVPDLLPEFAIVVHAARQEPLGRVLLEAAACGRAIVATNVGGTAEIFPSSLRAALLLPPDDPPALADAMQGVLNDPHLASTLGHNARARVCQTFPIERAADGLLGHYLELARPI